MTGDPAARPGSRAAPRHTAPRRRRCPVLAAADLAWPHRARGCAGPVIGADQMHAGLPQPCLLDGPADRAAGRVVHAHHDRAATGVGVTGHLVAPGYRRRRGIPGKLASPEVLPAASRPGSEPARSVPIPRRICCLHDGRFIAASRAGGVKCPAAAGRSPGRDIRPRPAAALPGRRPGLLSFHSTATGLTAASCRWDDPALIPVTAWWGRQ